MSEMMTPETPAKAAPKARATKTTKPATAASPLLNSRLLLCPRSKFPPWSVK
ncbi:hypothetical protein [Pannonibacter phragmitetus]|uniref:hypothetical protein n=1 Tax=Pannonibacter phragmitetus TaxID=121719 RepID=UPI003D2F45D8